MKQYAYIGCRTTKERNARGKGISVYEIQEGKWSLKQIEENLVNPSFLCFDENKEYLYTVHGDKSEISSFKIGEDGALKYINTVSTNGVNPVHLSVDKTNKWIFVANLQTGSVVVLPRNDDGSLGKVKELYSIPGKNINTISHPHQVTQDINREYLIVSCQGRKEGFGQVVVFKIDSEQGTLKETCTVCSREIAEPRHFVFHPNNIFCYGVNEKDYSVTAYDFDDKAGKLTAKQILPTLPDTYTGDGWASGIVIDKEGKYIVVSNRKHDSITSFSINQDTGKLSYCDCVKTDGGQPRYVVINESTGNIWVANETTDTLIEFSLNEVGKIQKTGKIVKTESPVCLIFK